MLCHGGQLKATDREADVQLVDPADCHILTNHCMGTQTTGGRQTDGRQRKRERKGEKEREIVLEKLKMCHIYPV